MIATSGVQRIPIGRILLFLSIVLACIVLVVVALYAAHTLPMFQHAVGHLADGTDGFSHHP